MQALKLPVLWNGTKFVQFSVRGSYFLKYRHFNAKPKFLESYKQNIPFVSAAHHVSSRNNLCPITHFATNRHLSTIPGKDSKSELQDDGEPPEKLTLIKRYKKMFKEYWYVLVPVHMLTSIVWFGSFYYASTCGLDIVPFLEYINLSEKLIEPLRNSSLGHIAVASACYKLATPARYMVTVGGSTFAVNFLKKRGLIRPALTKQEIKTMIKNKLKKDVSSGKKI